MSILQSRPQDQQVCKTIVCQNVCRARKEIQFPVYFEASSQVVPTVTPKSNTFIMHGAPQIPEDEILTMPADGLCFYHCVAAGMDVKGCVGLSYAEKVVKAIQVRTNFIEFIRADSIASRLELEGPEGYPGQDEMDFRCPSGRRSCERRISDCEDSGSLVAAPKNQLGKVSLHNGHLT